MTKPRPTRPPAIASRRRFLGSGFAAGAWWIGFGAWPVAAARAQAAPVADPAAAPPPGFGPWLLFAADGGVTALTNVADLGQGTHGAIAQIVAEELALPLARVQVVPAPIAPEFANVELGGHATYGSAGFTSAWKTLAPVCAAAREQLLRAAAAQWGVPVAQCRVADGAVHRDGPPAQRLDYAALRDAAARLRPVARPAPRSPKDWTVLGQPLPRADSADRVRGRTVYGMDVQRPDLKVAAVLHAPTFGGTLAEVDFAPALALPGVRKGVALKDAVAVVADGWWPAQQALQALRPVWEDGPHADLDSDRYREALLAAASAGRGRVYPSPRRQDAAGTAKALQAAARVIDLTFDVPFLAHATMEPMNATVEVGEGGAEIWLSTQSEADTRRGVAQALGLEPEKVVVHALPAGGGFGRRLEHDFAVEAALIAESAGGPVKTIWSREVDLRAGPFRPACAARVRLALGADGLPTGVRADFAGPSLLEYTGLTNSAKFDGFDWTLGMGWLGRSYALGAMDTRWTRVDRGVPCGYWRSVGNSQNGFFLECAIDHAARAAGDDGLAYRRRLLAGKPRALAFLEALAARAGWATPPAPGRHRGLALNEANGSFSGHVVEIEVPAPRRLRIVRITAAIDPGVVGNPRSVQAQMMGGTVFGLSAALFGEITLAAGRVEQGNFDAYRVLTIAQTPPLDVLVLAGGEQPGGVGEEGPPSIAPALANALLAATGEAVTRLPLSRAGWQLVA